MAFDFDAPFSRVGTDSVKWDINEEIFGRSDVIPLWVADMDFPAPKEVSEALCARAAHGAFGYTIYPEEFYDVFINWAKNRYNWDIHREWMVNSHGVVEAINTAIQCFTTINDPVLIQTPVYQPFFKSIRNNERQLVTSPLIETPAGYEMDFADLETKFASGVKMMILCSPHNPVGRVWRRDELVRLAQLLVRYNVLLISDEIHADIIYPGYRHIPIATLDETLARQCITLYAPGKTFNIAGLTTAVTIIPDEELRTQYCDFSNKMGEHIGNTLGITAFIAAYKYGGPWLDALNQYVWSNYQFVKHFVAEYIPQLRVTAQQGTFLLWLDCRNLPMKATECSRFFIDKAGLGLNDGTWFGKDGAGFMRMNIACRRSLIQQALEQLQNAVEHL